MWFNNGTETRSHQIYEQQLTLINMGYYFHVWNSEILKPLIYGLKFSVIRLISEFLKVALFVKLIADYFYFSNHLIFMYFMINKVLTTFVAHFSESEIHNNCYFHVNSFNIYAKVISYYAKQWLRGDFIFIKWLKEKKVYTKLLYIIFCYLFHLKSVF